MVVVVDQPPTFQVKTGVAVGSFPWLVRISSLILRLSIRGFVVVFNLTQPLPQRAQPLLHPLHLSVLSGSV